MQYSDVLEREKDKLSAKVARLREEQKKVNEGQGGAIDGLPDAALAT